MSDDFISRLRERVPEDFYSTMDVDSYEYKLGRWGEGAVISKLEKLCDPFHRLESTTTTEERSAAAAIGNSQQGDVRVLELVPGSGWVLKHTIEVKVSDGYENASISTAEFEDSRAKYLVAITLGGMWAVTMEEVRRMAIVHKRGFYFVPFREVRKVPLSEVVR